MNNFVAIASTIVHRREGMVRLGEEAVNSVNDARLFLLFISFSFFLSFLRNLVQATGVPSTCTFTKTELAQVTVGGLSVISLSFCVAVMAVTPPLISVWHDWREVGVADTVLWTRPLQYGLKSSCDISLFACGVGCGSGTTRRGESLVTPSWMASVHQNLSFPPSFLSNTEYIRRGLWCAICVNVCLGVAQFA